MYTDPPQFPAITFDGDEQNAIITVGVSGSSLKPVFAYGRPYKRVGRSNQRLTRDEVQRLMEETTGRTWDTLLCQGFNLADIDISAIRDYLKRGGQDIATDTMTVLRNLSLVNTLGEFVNATALLFYHISAVFHPAGTTTMCAFCRDFLNTIHR